VAGDDAEAKVRVSELIDEIGRPRPSAAAA
jgi:predicted dinucleotide-binding enzyme